MRAALAILLLTAALAAVPSASGQREPPPRYVDPGILDGGEQRRLDAARRSWKAAGVRSYSYSVRLTCFCPEHPSFRMVVRGGRPPAATPRELRDMATVPRMFQKIRGAIDRRVARIAVRYGRRGVPSSIAIDVDRMIADEESYYAISRFTLRRQRAG